VDKNKNSKGFGALVKYEPDQNHRITAAGCDYQSTTPKTIQRRNKA